MNLSQLRQHWLEYTLMGVWICNCLIAGIIAVHQAWIPHMDAGSDSYSHIRSAPFDGTVMPITYIPDWTKTANQDKSRRFEDISISDYIALPIYDAGLLLSDMQNTTKMSTILHYTYTVPYMGSYRFNYKEHDGSHLGVDIRAPIGTPVLSIANGVVVRTVEADASGNKFVVIRHDTVPMNGTKTSLYSGYLHLSQISVTEGSKIAKGEMLGRVGITGITTTPHLHFQIDTMDAPFHPYWPFTSSEAKNSGLGFLEAVSAGLGKENALKYTIHPMKFISTYIAGVAPETLSSAPAKVVSQPSESNPIVAVGDDVEGIALREREILLGGYKSSAIKPCDRRRFPDISEQSKFGKMLYPLVDDKCLFQEQAVFDPKSSVTLREGVINIMDYYGMTPAHGSSHFLDIGINDELQGYAVVLYRRGIIDGNYFAPDRILTKAEAIDLIVKIGNIGKNPGQIKIYNDVDTISPYFQSLQAYGFATRARGGKIYPNLLLTRSGFTGLLASLNKIKK